MLSNSDLTIKDLVLSTITIPTFPELDIDSINKAVEEIINRDIQVRQRFSLKNLFADTPLAKFNLLVATHIFSAEPSISLQESLRTTLRHKPAYFLGCSIDNELINTLQPNDFKNCLVIGSTINQQPVTREHPLLANAITTVAELQEALKQQPFSTVVLENLFEAILWRKQVPTKTLSADTCDSILACLPMQSLVPSLQSLCVEKLNQNTPAWLEQRQKIMNSLPTIHPLTSLLHPVPQTTPLPKTSQFADVVERTCDLSQSDTPTPD